MERLDYMFQNTILQNESLYSGRFLEGGSNLFICSSALQYKNGWLKHVCILYRKEIKTKFNGTTSIPNSKNRILTWKIDALMCHHNIVGSRQIHRHLGFYVELSPSQSQTSGSIYTVPNRLLAVHCPKTQTSGSTLSQNRLLAVHCPNRVFSSKMFRDWPVIILWVGT